jgi:hypothetical protein
MVVSHHQNIGQNHNLLNVNKSFQIMATLKVLGNNSNKSKLHSRRNGEQIKFGKFLLPFSSEFLVFLPPL